MRSSITLLAITLLPFSLGACGGSSGEADPTSRHSSDATLGNVSSIARTKADSTPPHAKLDRDGDHDNNDDDGGILYYGRAASPGERAQITALITRYYRAAAAEHGSRACSQLYPFLAESVAEELGHPGSPHERTCAAALSSFFRQHHRQFTSDDKVKVILTRVQGTKALAMLSFSKSRPVREISARSYGNGWRLVAIVDRLVE